MSDWYYAADNEQKGPVNESELKANLASAKLPADTLVWKDGMDNWTPANQVPAFSFRAPPAPAKVQPPAAAATPTAAASATKVVSASPTVNNPASATPVDLKNMMGTPESLEVDPADAEKNKIMGIIAYIGILCLVPLLAAKDSPFARYHANQGLVLFILEIVLGVGVSILSVVFSMIGIGMINFLLTLLDLVPLVLLVLGIINAANGKCVPLPVIGGVKLIK